MGSLLGSYGHSNKKIISRNEIQGPEIAGPLLINCSAFFIPLNLNLCPMGLKGYSIRYLSMLQKNFIIPIGLLIFASSCTHFKTQSSSSKQRCLATTNSQCESVFTSPQLNPQQMSLKDQLLLLAQDKSQQAQIIKSLDSLMPLIAKLSGENKLKPVLSVLAQKLLDMGKLPARFTQENLTETVDQLTTMIEHQFIAKNLSQKSKNKYISWLEACRKIAKSAQKTLVPPRGPGHSSAFENSDFIKELELVAESKFRRSSEVKLLVDGPQSFPLKEKLISEAKKSIYVMSWAFEKDTTGWKFAKLLAAQHKAGRDVRIIVDNKTAQQEIYGAVPAWLKEQGVPIIQWKDLEFPMYAFHKKSMIVDGRHLVDGGMNFGDVYSHMGPEATPKWRDTDFYANDNAAIDTQKVFIEVWNSQVDKNNLPYTKLVFDLKEHVSTENQNGPLIMTIDQVPNPEVRDPILASIIKGVEGTTTEINIENAYFIKNPAMNQALIRALKRGVKVRIFTNSPNSIDVPIIGKPILRALDDLYRFGAEVYLKQGATLHSKFMTVDGLASWIMSYNHHPQSMRLQGEIAHVILNRNFTGNLVTQFQTDISTLATKISDITSLQPAMGLLDIILQRYFFDQL